MANISWTTEKREISKLIPAEYNPRQLTEKQAKGLSISLERFNLADPIIINTDNTIIGGHQRINIIKAKVGNNGFMVDVRVPSRKLTPKEEKELNIRLNKNLGEWDYDLLANFDEDMLKGLGFDSKELDKIFQLDVKPEDDAVPENAPPVAKLGDIWQLGKHRVMCGDSTKREDVERLMDGKKADMVFTDPPYGVKYGCDNDKIRKQKGDKAFHWSKTRKNSQIQGDNKNAKELAEILWRPSFKNLFESAKDDCSFYMTMCQGGDQMMMMMMMSEHWQIKHELIWVKSSPVFSMGRLDYDYQHEPILFGWKLKHNWFGGGKFKSSVWEIPKPHKSDLHPTMKPIALIENAIYNSTQREALIIDLFLGSGSTLIACEKTNRICYGMEIDVKYCDVIIKRWEDYTKLKTAKLENCNV